LRLVACPLDRQTPLRKRTITINFKPRARKAQTAETDSRMRRRQRVRRRMTRQSRHYGCISERTLRPPALMLCLGSLQRGKRFKKADRDLRLFLSAPERRASPVKEARAKHARDELCPEMHGLNTHTIRQKWIVSLLVNRCPGTVSRRLRMSGDLSRAFGNT
jgi:hypothetical protein